MKIERFVFQRKSNDKSLITKNEICPIRHRYSVSSIEFRFLLTIMLFFSLLQFTKKTEKLQEKRDEEEQQTIPPNSDLHVYDDQVAICLEPKEKTVQVNHQSIMLKKEKRKDFFHSLSRLSNGNLLFVRVTRQLHI